MNLSLSKKFLFAIAALVVLAGASIGPLMSQVEQPKYDVVKKQKNLELRAYWPQLVAEVDVSGQRSEAIREGFKILADYIFGKNSGQSQIAMTAPVQQIPGEKIAMTAPVQQQKSSTNQDKWVVRFSMPSQYTQATLPKPLDTSITIKEIPKRLMLAVQFSGTANDALLLEKQNELLSAAKTEGLTVLSDPTFAFYNPPWTLPFLRRNEVLVEVQQKNP